MSISSVNPSKEAVIYSVGLWEFFENEMDVCHEGAPNLLNFGQCELHLV